MKIVEINGVNIGSTGKIMFGIAEELRNHGHDVWTFSPYYYQRKKTNLFPKIKGHTYFGYCAENMLHLRLSQLTGFHGCFSYFGTRQLVNYIGKIQPDVIHLHNLHNWTFNLPLLFSYLKKSDVKIIWTLHDCWSMTGQCPHFEIEQCNKWKTGCYACPKIHEYPKAFVDRTKVMWKLKKRWFSNIKDLTIVTPSEWLSNLVKKSYLKNYPVKVINNGIDLSIFNEKSNSLNFWNIKAGHYKYIVLGVAFDWSKKKGLDVFLELSKRLPKEYKIVLVGTNENIDKSLPANIISIHRTNNQKELAEIYSESDVFVNPTREDTYPTVNIEALACGTPVVTFKTGGSPEIIDDSCGIVVEKEDIIGLIKAIKNICENKIISRKSCIEKSKNNGSKERFLEYVKLIEK